MNNEDVMKDINRENEIFIRELMSKDSFMLDWYAGAVVPQHHPRYYDGRIEVNIRKAFNSSYGNISFGKDEYQISDDIVNKLYSYAENNIEKLIKLALNQTTEMYEFGGRDTLRIKFKSLYISISGMNASSEEEKNEIYKIKEDIKNIILENSKPKENREINDETIQLVIKGIAGTDDIDKNNLLFKLTKSIIDMSINTETTIAQLMKLDNNSVTMVDPLSQGEIFNSLMNICEKLNINVEVNYDEIGGLGYYYKFKKLN